MLNSTTWTTSNGMNAIVGSSNLCLHLRSSTSSTNPSSSMQQIESKAAVIAEKVRCSNVPFGRLNNVLVMSQESRNGIAMNKNIKTRKTPPAITPIASGLDFCVCVHVYVWIRKRENRRASVSQSFNWVTWQSIATKRMRRTGINLKTCMRDIREEERRRE